MRECKIVLPNETPDGIVSLYWVHDDLAKELSRTFGGVTAVPGDGAWITPEGTLQSEPVTVYMVAVKDGGADAALAEIAHRYGRKAEQRAVYWTGYDGEVHIDSLE
jgi:hypothetical protein